ncbi:MAG: UDP-N-acetylgalactosamine-undecaprenyl-phosphate N-acetylgalactosaminephosphotransferase [Calditrichaeota bacterium]|nr:UDP-N-acetylgalactosamine-undecaprenyl-phosphate N-acetylgalactosaminephosphotransferase [Calditrichota bacterium]
MGPRSLTWLIRHRAPALILIDVIAFQVALFFTWSLRWESDLVRDPLVPGFEILSAEYFLLSLVPTAYWLLIYALRGVYRRTVSISRYEAFIDVFKAVAVGLLVIFFVTWSPEPLSSTRLVLVTYGVLLVAGSGLGHVLFRSFIRALYLRRIGLFRSLIVGFGERGRKLFRVLHNQPEFGHRIEAVVVSGEDEQAPEEVETLLLPRLGSYLAAHPEIEYVLIALEPESRERVMEVIEATHFRGVRVMIMPDFFQILVGMAKSRELYGVPLLEVFPDPLGPAQRVIKRGLDIAVSLVLLIVTLLLMLLIAIAIKLGSRGPAFYVQTRIGKRGKEFKLYKFRSMYVGAERHTGAVWASERDPRITPVGRILRLTRLDELPQAFNVLRGDMSLVGPRPERKVFVSEFSRTIPFYNRRHNVKPGVTGWAQVRRGYDESPEDVREKLQYDLFYLENMSIGLDIKILLNTLLVVLKGRGR